MRRLSAAAGGIRSGAETARELHLNPRTLYNRPVGISELVGTYLTRGRCRP